MVGNFFFRCAVSSAALWNMKMKLLPQEPRKEKAVIFYDNGTKIKAVFK